MLPKISVDLDIPADVKKSIERLAISSKLQSPVPALVLSQSESEPSARLKLAFYEKHDLPTEFDVRIIVASGMEFLVIQGWIVKDLSGKSLRIDGARLTIE